MAYDLATAKQLIQQRGVQPPEGVDYDTWAMEWFENALNAGDPAVVRAAGGGAGAGWGEGQAEEGAGGIAPWQNAAPASEWLGKRPPTPRELRRYAQDQGWSEDFQRFDDRQLAQWLQRGGWDVNAGKFAGGVEKPTETGGLLAPGRGRGGGYAGWPGGGGGRRGMDPGGYVTNRQGMEPGATPAGQGGVDEDIPPEFAFTAPTWEEAMADPGYQFALKQGQQALEGSALARGVGRTSGTIKDLLSYNQDMATQQYGNVYGRQYDLAKAKFAPLYGSWETKYGGNLQKYLAKYNADLQKYLQREGNIYGLISQPPPSWPGYGG